MFSLEGCTLGNRVHSARHISDIVCLPGGQYLVTKTIHPFKVVGSLQAKRFAITSHRLLGSPLSGHILIAVFRVCTQLLRYWLPARTELAKLEILSVF